MFFLLPRYGSASCSYGSGFFAAKENKQLFLLWRMDLRYLRKVVRTIFLRLGLFDVLEKVPQKYSPLNGGPMGWNA